MKKQIMINLYGYDWTVEFVDKDDKELDGAWGITLNYAMKILIRNDLNQQLIKECVVHELTHAVLLTQGRGGPQKFCVEDLCEFIGFCGNTIIETANQIMEEYNAHLR